MSLVRAVGCPEDDNYYYEEGIYEEEEVEVEVEDEYYYEEEVVMDDNDEEEDEVVVEEEDEVLGAVILPVEKMGEEKNQMMMMTRMTSDEMEQAEDTAQVAPAAGRMELSDMAPAINYNVLVVENNGLQLGYDKDFGRATIATRDFLLRRMDDDDDRNNNNNNKHHDEYHSTHPDWLIPILRERPAILCTSNDYLEYMECFLNRLPTIQVGVLDMVYQPLDSPMGKSLLEPTQLLYLLGVLDDFTILHQLLSIYMTNAHQFRGTHSAMMILGSKFPHSCQPTIGYTSFSNSAADAAAMTATANNNNNNNNKEEDQQVAIQYNIDEVFVSYLIIRPIRAGQVVTTSYIADLFETPTPERRKLLQRTKSFWCQCPRCMGPDFCRVLPCPKCYTPIPCQYYDNNNKKKHQDTTTTTSSNNNPAPSYWVCSQCDTVADTDFMLSCERGLATTLSILERNIQRKTALIENSKEVTPSDVFDIIQECQQVLSFTHHLTIKALRLMVNLCTSRAYLQIKRYIVRGQLPPIIGTTLNPIPIPPPPSSSSSSSPAATTNSNTSISFAEYKHDDVLCQNFFNSVWAGFQLVLACECVAENCTGCGPLLVMGRTAQRRNASTTKSTLSSTTTTKYTEEEKDEESYIDDSRRPPNEDNSINPTTSSKTLQSEVSKYNNNSDDCYFPHPPLFDRATPMRHLCDNLLQLPVSWWPPHAVEMTQRYIPLLRAKFGSSCVDEFDLGIVQPFVTGCVRCYECGTTDSPTPWRKKSIYNMAAATTSSNRMSNSSRKDNTADPKNDQGTNKVQNKKKQLNRKGGNNKKKKNRR